MYLLQFNRKIFLLIFTFFLGVISLFFIPRSVNAMELSYYSYKDIYDQLPQKFKQKEYIYMPNKIPYISFATYNGQNDYKTSVKKSSTEDNYLYCMDYSKHVIFDKNFIPYNNMFSDKLRTYVGIALQYGTTNWGDLANQKFTTGNSILDYYMTQVVIHSLLYKYGGNKSNYGIDFNLLNYKRGTEKLKSKTKDFYEFCSKATIKLPDGNIETCEFSFEKPLDDNLLFDNNYIISPWIECTTNKNNAKVVEYLRSVNSDSLNKQIVIIEEKDKKYNSKFRIKIPFNNLKYISNGYHTINVSEILSFEQKVAGFWKAADSNLGNDKQEVGGLIKKYQNKFDKLQFHLLVGELTLYKTDSFSGDIIDDAEFEVYQFNDHINDYEFYQKLIYNPNIGAYECKSIIPSSTNKNKLFKVIESKSGLNYLNDWSGYTFHISKDNYLHEIHVKNQPKLGKLSIKKQGEDISYVNNKLIYNRNINLSDIRFRLFAADDIYIKDKKIFEKDRKVLDVLTNKDGEVEVKDLLPGKYYFKEIVTHPQYSLIQDKIYFEINPKDKNSNNTVSYNLLNVLKKVQINIFKYYTLNNNKLPLSNVTFGLFATNDIKNYKGEILLKKDSLIEKGSTDKNGILSFSNIPFGDYYIKELTTKDNFQLNSLPIFIQKNNYNQINNNIYEYNINQENGINYYKLKLLKEGEIAKFNNSLFNYDEVGPLSNLKFTLYAKEDIRIEDQIIYKAKEKITELVTDNNGEADYTKLLPGKYYLIEENTYPEFESKINKYEFEIKKNDPSNIPFYLKKIKNYLKKCEIVIYKYTKNNDGIKEPLENAKFGLYAGEDIINSNGEVIIKKHSLIREDISNKDGKIEFKNLPYYNYYIKEIEPPIGYIKDHVIEHISKDLFKYNSNKDIYSYMIYKENKKIDYHLKINKLGEYISNFKSEKNEIGDIYQYIYQYRPIKDVIFELYDDKNNLVMKKTTDNFGKIDFQNLIPGKYYYKEIKTGRNYQLNNSKKLIDLSLFADGKLNLSSKEENIKNYLCKCSLSIEKYGEEFIFNKKRMLLNQKALEGVVFGIYQNFDYHFSTGEILKKDSCIGYMVTDKEGKAKFEGKLPEGSFYIKELKTNTGYMIDDNKYLFDVNYNNNNINIKLENNNIFINKLMKGYVKIIKKDSNSGKLLSNVEFTLYNKNDTKLGKYKTNKKGTIVVKNLPYGEYYFIETKSKKGYYSSNNKYKFKIEDNNMVLLNINNFPILKLGYTERYKVCLFIILFFIILFLLFFINPFKRKKDE